MSEVKWIKIVTDIFDDEKIQLIETMPDADTTIVIWFKLLCLAGKQNNCGVFTLNDKIAYTDEMLAAIFRRPLNTVRMALQTFETFGMVEIINGVITIPNWEKHQNLDTLQSRKEYMREYMKDYRAKQAQLTDVNSCKRLRKQEVNRAESDKESELESDTLSKDKVSTADLDMIMAAWNSIGLQEIISIAGNRRKLLKARIHDYSVEDVLKAIENVKASPFLQGQNDKGWTISFDWFIKPNNFPKVLEGNYADKKKPGKQKWGAERITEVDESELDSALDAIRGAKK